MIGYFKILQLEGSDAAGSAVTAQVESVMDDGILGTLYLPPYLRPTQCGIAQGSIVWGIMDDTSGIGCALWGQDCDFDYTVRADLHLTKSLQIDGDTTSQSGSFTTTTGDVVVQGVSLTKHTHPFTGSATVTGAVSPVGVVEASGPATGTTNKPL